MNVKMNTQVNSKTPQYDAELHPFFSWSGANPSNEFRIQWIVDEDNVGPSVIKDIKDAQMRIHTGNFTRLKDLDQELGQ